MAIICYLNCNAVVLVLNEDDNPAAFTLTPVLFINIYKDLGSQAWLESLGLVYISTVLPSFCCLSVFVTRVNRDRPRLYREVKVMSSDTVSPSYAIAPALTLHFFNVQSRLLCI